MCCYCFLTSNRFYLVKLLVHIHSRFFPRFFGCEMKFEVYGLIVFEMLLFFWYSSGMTDLKSRTKISTLGPHWYLMISALLRGSVSEGYWLIHLISKYSHHTS